MIPLMAAVLACLPGSLILFRVPRCRRVKGICSPAGVSVIIPARNEEKNLARLLDSIAAQADKPLEVIVVDDGSADSTAQVALKAGAKVIASSGLPEGWTGKNWACHQGAAAASGEYLLFMDADTFFVSGGLESITGEYGGGALSIVPIHEVRKPYERLSAFFNLMMIMGTGAFTVLGESFGSRGLFGQFLLIEAGSYRKAGGHEAVKGRVLENFSMAVTLRELGIPVTCRGGRGSVGMRMYPDGISSLVRGWRKAILTGAGTAPPLLTGMASAWLFGGMLAFLMALLPTIAGSSIPMWLPYIAFSLQMWYMLRSAGTYGVLTALVYPVPLMFFFAVFSGSVIRKLRGIPEEWKGRKLAQGKGDG